MLIIICSPVALLLQLQRNEDCMHVFYIMCTHAAHLYTHTIGLTDPHKPPWLPLNRASCMLPPLPTETLTLV